MIKTTDTIVFHPARRKLRPSVRAAKRDHMRIAALAAVKGEIFTHDPERHGFTGRQIFGAVNRLPKRAEIAPGKTARVGAIKIDRIFSAHVFSFAMNHVLGLQSDHVTQSFFINACHTAADGHRQLPFPSCRDRLFESRFVLLYPKRICNAVSQADSHSTNLNHVLRYTLFQSL